MWVVSEFNCAKVIGNILGISFCVNILTPYPFWFDGFVNDLISIVRVVLIGIFYSTLLFLGAADTSLYEEGVCLGASCWV